MPLGTNLISLLAPRSQEGNQRVRCHFLDILVNTVNGTTQSPVTN